jgi:type I restriction enzyme S subunit
MAAWPLARLGDLLNQAAYGTSVKCSDTPSGIPVLRMGNVRYDGSLDLADLKYARLPNTDIIKFGLEPGDVIFNRTNSKELVGKTGLWDGRFKAAAASYFIRIRINREIVLPEWVWLYMNSPSTKRRLFETARGAIGQANINSEELKAFVLPLPPLDEQRRIVGLLDRAAEIRRRADAARAKARAIIPALFLDTFGDPASNPRGWPIRALGDLGELDRGRSRHRPRNAPELYGGPFPFVQTGDVANSRGRIRRHEQTYSEQGLAQSRIWPAGTLCITIAANIGKTGILEFNACFPDSIVGFTACAEVTSEFIQATLHFMQAEIEARAPQAAQKNINLQVLRGLAIPCPPRRLQTAFAEQVQRIEALARHLDAAAAKAEAMAAGLSAEVFDQAPRQIGRPSGGVAETTRANGAGSR